MSFLVPGTGCLFLRWTLSLIFVPKLSDSLFKKILYFPASRINIYCCKHPSITKIFNVGNESPPQSHSQEIITTINSFGSISLDVFFPIREQWNIKKTGVYYTYCFATSFFPPIWSFVLVIKVKLFCMEWGHLPLALIGCKTLDESLSGFQFPHQWKGTVLSHLPTSLCWRLYGREGACVKV